MQRLTAVITSFLLPLLILGAGVGGLIVFGERPEVPTKGLTGPTSPLVKTATANAFNETVEIEIEGVSAPYRQINLSAQVDGQINKMPESIRAGKYVNKGDFLLEIDPTDYQLEVRRLENQLRQANEELAAVDIDYKNTSELFRLSEAELAIQQRLLTRSEKLKQRDVLTDTELDKTRMTMIKTQVTLQQYRNQLLSHQQRKKTLAAARDLVAVQLELAKVNLKRTKIQAPVTGTIVKTHVEQDDFIKRGEPVLAMNETERMEVRCSLQTDELYWIWLHAGVLNSHASLNLQSRFEVPRLPVIVVYNFEGVDYGWDGVLSRFEGTGLDESTRTIPARVLVPRPTQVRILSQQSDINVKPPALYSGMYVKVRMPVQPPFPLLKIPTAALRPGEKVWVVRDGKLQILKVRVAYSTPVSVWIKPTADVGLQAGEQVVISPLANARSGAPVRIEE